MGEPKAAAETPARGAVTCRWTPAPCRFQQLFPTLVRQIAAGEIVERPDSVRKEFLENAVDAGRTRIELEVERGGADLLRVTDNGCGIADDDLPLAFARHATSKLSAADDLFRIATLGIRREALASIGSIAQVTLRSRPPGQACGADVTCHGGQLSPVRAWNGAACMRVEVRHLFYNTPVRRKFLRGVGTEMGHITEMFTRLALSPVTPQVTLRHNGKSVQEVPLAADSCRQFATTSFLLGGADPCPGVRARPTGRWRPRFGRPSTASPVAGRASSGSRPGPRTRSGGLNMPLSPVTVSPAASIPVAKISGDMGCEEKDKLGRPIGWEEESRRLNISAGMI
jgi:hypothetical protein